MTNLKEETLKVLNKEGYSMSDIAWAAIEYRNIKPKRFVLPPNTNEETKISFIDTLNFLYNDGFGCQLVYGNIVLKDNSWLERAEYDGSEWWAYKTAPVWNESLISPISNMT